MKNIEKNSQTSFSIINMDNLIGYQFLGNCNPTQIYGNKFYAANDGLLLGDYNTSASSDMGLSNASN